MSAFSRSPKRRADVSRIVTLVLWLVALPLIFVGNPAPANAASSTIVISQVYGAGGNTGATYKNDYIELFNRGTTTVNLSTYSVQYTSSSGPGNFTASPLSGSIAPGKYFLVQESGGTNGSALPVTADVTGTLNMGATAGKVILASTTTSLACNGGSTPCSAAHLAQIVDLVGYGTGTNFFEGSVAPAPSTTNAIFRSGGGCTDTDNNGSDFSTAAAAPRNSGTAAAPCSGGASNPTGIGAANPNPVNAGSSTLLTVAVTPGTSPTSTGIGVTANLSAIGGSATAQLFDDGTNGDVTAGDNTFSLAYTVSGGTARNTYSLPFGITDAQSRSGSGSINLSVNGAATTPIYTIQGTGTASPLVGSTVTTSGIVTGFTNNGFFLQDPAGDGNSATSDGLFVFRNGTALSTFALGDNVSVTGAISEYKSVSDTGLFTITELTLSSYSITSHTNPLPAAVELNPPYVRGSSTNYADDLAYLEARESMRVKVTGCALVVAPSNAYYEYAVVNPANGAYQVTGSGSDEYHVFQRDFGTNFDQRGLLLGVDDADTSGTSTATTYGFRSNVKTTDCVSGIVGPLDNNFGAYKIQPQKNDPAANPVVTSGPGTYKPLPSLTNANDFRITSFNVENYFDTVNLGRSGEVVLTQNELDQKTAKIAHTIVDGLKSPALIGLEEVENTTVLDALTNGTGQSAGYDNLANLGATYNYIFRDGQPSLGDDPRGIDVALLYNPARVTINNTHYFNCTPNGGGSINDTNTTFTCAEDDETTTGTKLFPRRPMIVDLTYTATTGDSIRLAVIVNHFKSKGSCTEPVTLDCTPERTNEARELAKYIDGTVVRRIGSNVVVLGDLNDFENSQPINQFTAGGTVSTTLLDLPTTVPADVRYGYNFNYAAQILDHVMASQAMAGYFAGYEELHSNSDYPVYTDTARTEAQYTFFGSLLNGIAHESDHDPATATFTVPAATPPFTTTISDDQAGTSVSQNTTISYTLTFTNNTGAARNTTITIPVPVSLRFVLGSLYLNGVAQSATLDASGNLVLTANIAAGGTATVTFQGVVQDYDPLGTNIEEFARYAAPGVNCTSGACKTDTNFNTVSGAPLVARIGYVKVAAIGRIEWAAARETNAIGYSLDAVDAAGKLTRLTPALVPTHSALGQPDGLYSRTVSIPAGTVGILLNDVEAGGKVTAHGSYAIGQTFGKAPTYAPAPQTEGRSPSTTPTAPLRLSRADAALSIAQDGIYRLTYEALNAQGIDLRGVKPAKLALSSNGAGVGLYVKAKSAAKFQAGDYIEFVATARDDFYNGSSIYVLTVRPQGKVVHLKDAPSVTGAPKPGNPAAATVSRTLPGRKLYWAEAPASDNPWTWALLENDVPELADQSVSFDLPRLYNSDSYADQMVEVTLTLRGWGGYPATFPDHHAIAELAGVTGDVKFDGNGQATLSLKVRAAALKATSNSLRLRAPGDLGVQYDTLFLENIRVSYPQATALPDALTHVADVRPFTRAADLRASISKQGGSRTDYLIVAPAEFAAGVAPIALQHKSEGLRVATVDVNAVYDSYSAGAVDPAALQKFVADLKRTRGTAYVLLVGADSTDPRDYLKQANRSFVPAFCAPDSEGTRAASDAAYADVDGDGLPDVALGRLPVRNVTELQALVAKSVAFGSQKASLNATFVTDPTQTTFAAKTDANVGKLPQGTAVTRITWGKERSSANAATAALLAQWQKGSRIVDYIGHSNSDQWADVNVFDAGDLSGLANSTPALVAVWGCWAATYDQVGAPGLSQALLTLTNGGAAAVIASTTEVAQEEYAPTSQAFYAALYAGGTAQRIGDAFVNAKRTALAQHRDWTDLARGLTLLGDPAARM